MLQDRVEDVLRARVEDATRDAPEPLAAAMRHAVLEGGSRLRPRVCVAVALALGDPSPWLTDAAACSLELIHAASLAHDDLPCFDDADLRRGRPSLHRSFGVPVALLAGDALIVMAFEVLARETPRAPRQVGALVSNLARGSGVPHGIAAGQAAELSSNDPCLRMRKTSALFECAAAAGAIAAGTDPAPWTAMGRLFGEAFQVADDVHDVRGGLDLGKPSGRDSALGRPNVAISLGLDRAQAQVKVLHRAAMEAIPPGARRDRLAEILDACVESS